MEDGRGDHYWYDAEGQLTDAYYGAIDPVNSPHGQVREDHFYYDALGNRVGWDFLANRGWMNFARRDNGLNQYTSWENNDPNPPGHWGSGIFSDDNSPFAGYTSFPGNGVTMADGWIVASYNAVNQPVAIGSSATWATGNWMWFGYDPLGRCVKRVLGPSADSGTATCFYYDGWNLVQEGPDASSIYRLYIHGGRVDEIVASYNAGTGVMAYHYYDAAGHCMLLTDWQGNIMEQYYYNAFGWPYVFDGSGNYQNNTSPFGNRFLFTGREWLSDLKLYDYRNRMYQPELGRFLQPDPKEFGAGDYNLYRYCHNDPVNKSDPMGLADSVAIEFAPQQGNVFLQIVPDKYVNFVGGSESRAASIMLPQGGLTTTATQDPKTGDIHVQQTIKITTWVKQSEDAAGNTSKLAKEELSRVQLFRDGAGTAQDKANNLAREGFKNVESAKKAVEESTKKTMLDKAHEGKLRWDLPGGGWLRLK
jgi:RHS repeat-associated protein